MTWGRLCPIVAEGRPAGKAVFAPELQEHYNFATFWLHPDGILDIEINKGERP
jgi:hypothetical protein